MINEKVDLFFKAMVFTPSWGIVACLLMIHFFASWYQTAKRTGWKLDSWYFALFFGIFQSSLMTYPFCASPFNKVCTLGQIERIAPFVDQAFAISILGYCSIWIGRYCFDFTKGRFVFFILVQFLQPLSQVIEANVKSKKVVTIMTSLSIILGLAILFIQFTNGYFFNGRAFFLKNPYLRPFFNIAISVFPIALNFATLRFIQFKEKKNLFFISLLLIISLFFGARFIFLNGLLFLFVQRSFYRAGVVSLFKTGALCAFLLLLAVVLSHFRDGNYNLLSAIASTVFNFFYGNNFSDTRDFAWILSYWDGEYLYGKSFVSAFMSFIPRVFCEFREEWSFCMYTNNLLGFDSEIMPGLRPGLFGEPYLNFGWIGVIFFGSLFGFLLRYTDLKLKESVKNSKDIIKGHSSALACYLLQCLMISAGMWMFYIFVLINLATIPFREKSNYYRNTPHCGGFVA